MMHFKIGSKFFFWCAVFIIALCLTACGGSSSDDAVQQPAATTPPDTVESSPPTAAPTATQTPIPTLSASDHLDMGMDFADQGDHENALAEFMTAIELEPNNADAHRNLGSVYGEQMNLEAAAAAYEEAIRLNPNFGEAYGDLTGIYVFLGRLDEAVAVGQQAIELSPDYSTAYNNLGIAYGSQGNIDLAIAQFETAIEINPEDAMAHYNLGFAYENLGQLDQAIVQYEQAIQIDPDDYADPRENLGTVYAKQGEFEKAIAEWEISLTIDPTDAKIHQNMGMAYAQLGQVEEAIAELEIYLQLAPDAPDIAMVEQEIARLAGSISTEPPATPAGAELFQTATYSILYPEGWQTISQNTLTAFYESDQILTEDVPSVPLVLIESGSLDAISDGEMAGAADAVGMLEAIVTERADADTNPVVGDVQSIVLAGQPAAMVEVQWVEDDIPVGLMAFAIHMGDWGILIQAVGEASSWATFGAIYADMVNSLEILADAKVDFTNPAAVVQAVFTAAQTANFGLLPGLCDPQGENDDDTALICAISADHPDVDTFIQVFANGKINGEVVIDVDNAQVPFLFGPEGDSEEVMNLILRDGNWYLFDF